MTPTDDLHQILRSLTVSEKGYCKKYLRGFAGKNEELLTGLFDAVCSQAEYDEQALKKKFSAGKSRSHFAVMKHSLYSKVLEAVAQYHQKTSRFAGLFNGVLAAEVLFRKGVRSAATAQLEKVAESARSGELHEIYLLAMKYRNRFIMDFSYRFQNLDSLNEDSLRSFSALHQVDTEQKLFRLFMRMEYIYFMIGKRAGEETEAEVAIIEQEAASLMQSGNHSRHAMLMYDDLQLRIHYSRNNMEEIGRTCMHIRHTIEEYNFPMHLEFPAYMNATLTEAGQKIIQRDFVQALKIKLAGYIHLNRHITLPQRVIPKYLGAFFSNDVNILNRLGRPEYAQSRVQSLNLHWEKIKPTLSDLGQLIIQAEIAWCYLLRKEPEKTLRILNEVLRITFQGNMFDSFLKLRIILFVTHVDLSNFDILPSLIQSYRFFVRSKKSLNAFDKAILLFFSKLSRDQIQKKDWENFAHSLDEMEASADLKKYAGVSYFPLSTWALSKAQDADFAETTRKRVPQPSETVLKQFSEVTHKWAGI